MSHRMSIDFLTKGGAAPDTPDSPPGDRNEGSSPLSINSSTGSVSYPQMIESSPAVISTPLMNHHQTKHTQSPQSLPSLSAVTQSHQQSKLPTAPPLEGQFSYPLIKQASLPISKTIVRSQQTPRFRPYVIGPNAPGQSGYISCYRGAAFDSNIGGVNLLPQSSLEALAQAADNLKESRRSITRSPNEATSSPITSAPASPISFVEPAYRKPVVELTRSRPGGRQTSDKGLESDDENSSPSGDAALNDEDVDKLFAAARSNRNIVKGKRDVAMLSLLLDMKLSCQKIADLQYRDIRGILDKSFCGIYRFGKDKKHPNRAIRCHEITANCIREWVECVQSSYGWQYDPEAPLFVPVAFQGDPTSDQSRLTALKRDAVSKVFTSLKTASGVTMSKETVNRTHFRKFKP